MENKLDELRAHLRAIEDVATRIYEANPNNPEFIDNYRQGLGIGTLDSIPFNASVQDIPNNSNSPRGLDRTQGRE